MKLGVGEAKRKRYIKSVHKPRIDVEKLKVKEFSQEYKKRLEMKLKEIEQSNLDNSATWSHVVEIIHDVSKDVLPYENIHTKSLNKEIENLSNK